jgi:hypothetical protein
MNNKTNEKKEVKLPTNSLVSLFADNSTALHTWKAEYRSEKCTITNTITLSRVNNLTEWLDEQEDREELLTKAMRIKMTVLENQKQETKQYLKTKYNCKCTCMRCHVKKQHNNAV